MICLWYRSTFLFSLSYCSITTYFVNRWVKWYSFRRKEGKCSVNGFADSVSSRHKISSERSYLFLPQIVEHYFRSFEIQKNWSWNFLDESTSELISESSTEGFNFCFFRSGCRSAHNALFVWQWHLLWSHVSFHWGNTHEVAVYKKQSLFLQQLMQVPVSVGDWHQLDNEIRDCACK